MLALRFRFFCAAVALGMVVMPIVPPEHVHDMIESDGHHHLVGHRHAPAHSLITSHRHQAEFDDVDPVLTVESTFVTPPSVGLSAPSLVVVRAHVVPTAPVIRRSSELVERVIHGPPRPQVALRAPPSSVLI